MKSIYQLSALAAVVAVVGAGCGGGGGSKDTAQTYQQQERLARPVVNEVFATVANNRHLINDTDNPTNDPSELRKDVRGFMKFPAGRSEATINAVDTVLVPDVMVADLSKRTPAAYLGVETKGATGGTFGGRKLQDDVVDISLGIIFGNTISALKLAPDDGKEIPSLTTDNVGPTKTYFSTFPYLPTPR
ncbi:protein of unknown function (DUF4331) [Abditibacterium utsteinense]|uniref:DUF4331 domain-containing protein n=1 Tax=Abditibacterium utsteinense TaxID=1960156 RepID=A0A2S8SRB6_9BACT|nr:DUF4331 family protein [Abditibacterium utsteinense]PQV63337.1 protein of unknown function (DUF4331) [Abditibacterium utsteinense]